MIPSSTKLWADARLLSFRCDPPGDQYEYKLLLTNTGAAQWDADLTLFASYPPDLDLRVGAVDLPALQPLDTYCVTLTLPASVFTRHYCSTWFSIAKGAGPRLLDVLKASRPAPLEVE